MRLLVQLEHDSKQELAISVTTILSELFKRFKVKPTEVKNIISVAQQMSEMENVYNNGGEHK